MTEELREPSCVLNHDAIRRDMWVDRQEGMIPCPACGWLLRAWEAPYPGPLDGITRYDICPVWGMEEDPEGRFVKLDDVLERI